MRRRLPAGLRWRLLLALVATSAVTLGATALVVLPPLQDRLRDQSVESLETAVLDTESAFEEVFARLDKSGAPLDAYEFEFFEPSDLLRTRSPNARVLVQDDSTVPSDPEEGPPGFLYDSEFSDELARPLHMANRGAYGPVTEMNGASVLVARPLEVDGRLAGVVVAERELSERIHLSVLKGTEVLTLLTQAPPHVLQTVAWVGRSVPAHNTSSGRSLVIDLGRAELARLFARTDFGVGGPNAPRDVDELYERILVARLAGFAIIDEEYEPGLVAASAPVRGFRGDVVAALNVSGPKFRLGSRLPFAGEKIKAAADELSTQLGWDGRSPLGLAGRAVGPKLPA